MEFPEIGQHCAKSSCAKLDFLPFPCDACHKVFCLEHRMYESHQCPDSHSQDVQVPICPLCSQPVPVKRGEDPNKEVDLHIQRDCKNQAMNKIPTYRCTFKTCKSKEMVEVKCATCQKIFCIKHRHETNHNCEGPHNRLGGVSIGSGVTAAVGSSVRSKEDLRAARLAALGQNSAPVRGPVRDPVGKQRSQARPAISKTTPTSGVSADTAVLLGEGTEYDEDEALARAIAASLQETQTTQETTKKEAKKSENKVEPENRDNCTLS